MFCAHKWIRDQKNDRHIRHYTSRTVHHCDVRLKHYMSYYRLSQVYFGLRYAQKSGSKLKGLKNIILVRSRPSQLYSDL